MLVHICGDGSMLQLQEISGTSLTLVRVQRYMYPMLGISHIQFTSRDALTYGSLRRP